MKRLAGIIVAALIASVAPVAAQFASPGIISLGDFQISSAGSQTTPASLQQGTPTGGQATLPGVTALSCQVRFNYGAGGTKTNVYIQTSLDGSSYFDIANIAFTTASGVETINLSGLNSVTTPTAPSYLSLADNTTFNGPLGDRFQAVVVSTGTYSGGTLASVRCSPR